MIDGKFRFSICLSPRLTDGPCPAGSAVEERIASAINDIHQWTLKVRDIANPEWKFHLDPKWKRIWDLPNENRVKIWEALVYAGMPFRTFVANPADLAAAKTTAGAEQESRQGMNTVESFGLATLKADIAQVYGKIASSWIAKEENGPPAAELRYSPAEIEARATAATDYFRKNLGQEMESQLERFVSVGNVGLKDDARKAADESETEGGKPPGNNRAPAKGSNNRDDFHELFHRLLEFPRLMRFLGLIIDVTAECPALIPGATYGLTWGSGGGFQSADSIEVKFDWGSPPVFEIANNESFRRFSEDGKSFQELLTIDAMTPAITVHQMRVRGVYQGTTSKGPPPLRSSGLAVVYSDHAPFLNELVQPPQAQQYQRGEVVHVQDLAKSGQWQSLMRRECALVIHRLASTGNAEGDAPTYLIAWFKGVLEESVAVIKIERGWGDMPPVRKILSDKGMDGELAEEETCTQLAMHQAPQPVSGVVLKDFKNGSYAIATAGGDMIVELSSTRALTLYSYYRFEGNLSLAKYGTDLHEFKLVATSATQLADGIIGRYDALPDKGVWNVREIVGKNEFARTIHVVYPKGSTTLPSFWSTVDAAGFFVGRRKRFLNPVPPKQTPYTPQYVQLSNSTANTELIDPEIGSLKTPANFPDMPGVARLNTWIDTTKPQPPLDGPTAMQVIVVDASGKMALSSGTNVAVITAQTELRAQGKIGDVGRFRLRGDADIQDELMEDEVVDVYGLGKGADFRPSLILRRAPRQLTVALVEAVRVDEQAYRLRNIETKEATEVSDVRLGKARSAPLPRLGDLIFYETENYPLTNFYLAPIGKKLWGRLTFQSAKNPPDAAGKSAAHIDTSFGTFKFANADQGLFDGLPLDTLVQAKFTVDGVRLESWIALGVAFPKEKQACVLLGSFTTQIDGNFQDEQLVRIVWKGQGVKATVTPANLVVRLSSTASPVTGQSEVPVKLLGAVQDVFERAPQAVSKEPTMLKVASDDFNRMTDDVIVLRASDYVEVNSDEVLLRPKQLMGCVVYSGANGAIFRSIIPALPTLDLKTYDLTTIKDPLVSNYFKNGKQDSDFNKLPFNSLPNASEDLATLAADRSKLTGKRKDEFDYLLLRDQFPERASAWPIYMDVFLADRANEIPDVRAYRIIAFGFEQSADVPLGNNEARIPLPSLKKQSLTYLNFVSKAICTWTGASLAVTLAPPSCDAQFTFSRGDLATRLVNFKKQGVTLPSLQDYFPKYLKQPWEKLIDAKDPLPGATPPQPANPAPPPAMEKTEAKTTDTDQSSLVFAAASLMEDAFNSYIQATNRQHEPSVPEKALDAMRHPGNKIPISLRTTKLGLDDTTAEGRRALIKDFLDFAASQSAEMTNRVQIASLGGVPSGSLPTLQYGHPYKVRLAVKDVVGHSVRWDAKIPGKCESEYESECVIYRRYDPIAQPLVYSINVGTDGMHPLKNVVEACSKLAVRSSLRKRAYELDDDVGVEKVMMVLPPAIHRDTDALIKHGVVSPSRREDCQLLNSIPAVESIPDALRSNSRAAVSYFRDPYALRLCAQITGAPYDWDLREDDILDATSLAQQVTNPISADSVAAHLWMGGHYDPTAYLADVDTQMSNLLALLNAAVRNPSFLVGLKTDDIQLRPETKKFLARNATEIERWRGNRMLLEDAFPGLIAQRQTPPHGSATGTLPIIRLDFHGKWPSIAPIPVILRGVEGGQMRMERFLDGIRVDLPPGEVCDLRLSATVREEQYNNLGIAEWDSPCIRNATLFGQHPLVSGTTTVRLIHAVSGPAAKPAFFKDGLKLGQQRAAGSREIKVVCRVSYDTSTTGRIDLNSKTMMFADDPRQLAPTLPLDAALEMFDPFLESWDEASMANFMEVFAAVRDQPGDLSLHPAIQPYFAGLSTAEEIFLKQMISHFATDVTENALAKSDPFDRPEPGEAPRFAPRDFIQTLPDTRCRKLLYSPVASTCFEPLCRVLQSISGEPGALMAPATVAPLPPEISFIMPLYGWNTTGALSSGEKVRQTRKGFAVRIFLRRGWFSSGQDEMLAVIFSPSGNNTPTRLPMTEMAFDPVATAVQDIPAEARQLSIDSIGMVNERPEPGFAVIKADFPHPEAPSAAMIAKDGNKTVQWPPIQTAVHPVRYSPHRGLWYCDILFKHSFEVLPTPFLRLAVARYQPNAPQEIQLSKTVRLDLFPLQNSRTATLERMGARQYTLTVAGVFSKDPRLVDKQLARKIRISMVRRPDEDSHLPIEEVVSPEAVALVNPTSNEEVPFLLADPVKSGVGADEIHSYKVKFETTVPGSAQPRWICIEELEPHNTYYGQTTDRKPYVAFIPLDN
jgi:hypothetical protein